MDVNVTGTQVLLQQIENRTTRVVFGLVGHTNEVTYSFVAK